MNNDQTKTHVPSPYSRLHRKYGTGPRTPIVVAERSLAQLVEDRVERDYGALGSETPDVIRQGDLSGSDLTQRNVFGVQPQNPSYEYQPYGAQIRLDLLEKIKRELTRLHFKIDDVHEGPIQFWISDDASDENGYVRTKLFDIVDGMLRKEYEDAMRGAMRRLVDEAIERGWERTPTINTRTGHITLH